MDAVFAYFRRDFIKWTRGRVGVVSALVMPAAWLVFVGLAMPIRFTDNYIDFITPGILAMSILNGSLQGGALLIFDRMLGFLNKFLAMPSSRESILFGKILFITVRGLVQASIILVFAFFLGASLYTLPQLAGTYAILVLFGVMMSGFGTTIALHVMDHDGYAAVTAMISLPIFFTSSALMPYALMPEWLKVPAMINPLSFAIDAIRLLQVGVIAWDKLAGLAILCVVVLGVSVHRFRRVKI